MLQFFSQWFHTLILVLILASLIEMLLPSRSMERYIRLVLSLTVLMAILGPVFNLLDSRWQEEQWLLDWYLRNGVVSGETGDIQQQSATIQKIQQEQAMQLLEQGIQEEIAREVKSRFAVDVEHVTVTVEETGRERGNHLVLRAIELRGRRIARPEMEPRDETAWAPMNERLDIQPVEIQIPGSFAAKNPNPAPLLPQTGASSEMEQQLREWLASSYQLEMSQITVSLDG